jgi:hypothetical protein
LGGRGDVRQKECGEVIVGRAFNILRQGLAEPCQPRGERSTAGNFLRYLPGQGGGNLTRKDCALPLQSNRHSYDKPLTCSITVKVLDFLGNDTSQTFVVVVKQVKHDAVRAL